MKKCIATKTEPNQTAYFKSIQDKYIFILLNTDGNIRMNLLEEKDECYSDIEVAIEWRNNIFTNIIDYPDEGVRDLAIKTLHSIFITMINGMDEGDDI